MSADNERDPQPVRVTQPLVRCQNCGRVAPWTDGRSKAAGDEVDEVWCQTCSFEFPLPGPLVRAYEAMSLAADPPPPGLAAHSLAAIDSAGAVSAHLTARRAVEDMAAAHREQLAAATQRTARAADDAERWRAEAEAARAQVGTLTAERDRYRAALERIAEFDMTPLGKLAREALGTAREETT